MAVALAAALIRAAGAAAAEAPGPGEVIGYAAPDRSGPSKTWRLPPDRPYLYVPYVGDDVDGAVAAVDTGPGVGVALFQRPFFASRDVGCLPAVGTDARSDLKWLGATARFAPAPAHQPSGPGTDPGAAGGYASLIVYRDDLGPPPGALLLDRRSTIGIRCRNPIHKTVYDRVFVPVAGAPETARCFDLAGTYRYEGSQDKVLDFTASDRLVLLMPADLDDRYRTVRHDVTATLFDGLGCRGVSVSFKSGASLTRDFRLGRSDFRDRARSVRIVYENGALAPYLIRPAAPAPEPTAQETEPAPKPTAQETEPAPAEPEDTLAAAPRSGPAPAAEAPPTPAPAPEPTAPEPTAPEPGSAAATPAARAEPAPAPRPKPEPAEAQAQAKPGPAEAPAARSEPAEPVPAPASSPREVQQALPKLRPVLPPPAGKAPPPAGQNQTFRFPVYEIYRLNYCLHRDKDCGEPAAAAWCRARGFARAAAWKIDENIGGLFPTIVMGEERVCAQFVCDGFREITCAR